MARGNKWRAVLQCVGGDKVDDRAVVDLKSEQETNNCRFINLGFLGDSVAVDFLDFESLTL